jgi:hypothetical protein
MRVTAARQGTAVGQALEGWRRKHGGRGLRIPERLWTQAELRRSREVDPFCSREVTHSKNRT